MKMLWIALALTLGGLACSEECAREACDEVHQAQGAGTLEQGLVGVIAYSTDACENGCCECTYSSIELDVYAVSAPVTSAAQARAQLEQATPVATIAADERYAQALDEGMYVVCVRDFERCANIEIAAGDVTTLNVRTLYGPTQLVVFDANGAEQPTWVLS